MKKIFYLIVASLLSISLMARAGLAQTTALNVETVGIKERINVDLTEVNYDGYHNSRYHFGVQYPDFLMPQGESESGDGQRFISSDGNYVMAVYRDVKALTGESPSLQDAYDAERRRLSHVMHSKLNDNYYWFQGKIKRTRHYQQYTFLLQNEYFTLYMEYPLAAEAALKPIIQHVAASFSVAAAETGEQSDEFVSFLHEFLEVTFWENNLNALLRDNHKLLKPYLDPKHDVRRYHSPGAVPHLYARADNFGFDNLTDFTTTVELPGESSYAELTPDMSVCELDFERSGSTTIYYGPSAWEFTALVNPETFEFAPILSPYPDAAVMQVFVPMYYQGFVNPRGLYFIQSPDGWKLMFVDDSLCGA